MVYLRVTDQTGVITYANAEFSRLLGYTNVTGKHCSMLHACFPSLQQVQEPHQLRIFSATAKQIPVNIETKLLEQGEFIHVISQAPEITRDQAYWKTLCSAARDGIVIIGSDHRVITANPRFCRMLGYSEEELKDLHTWDYDFLLSETDVRTQFQLSQDIDRTVVTKHVRKDGTIFDVQVSITGVAGGQEGLFLCICRDITEELRMEAERKQQAEEIRAILESIHDAFISLDSSWRYRYANSKVLKFLGKTQEELFGGAVFEMIPEFAAELIEKSLAQAQRSGKPVTSEAFHDQSGEWYEARVHPAEDQLMVFFKQITEEKIKQEHLEFQQSFRRLLGDISSDFIKNHVGFYNTLHRALERTGAFFSADRCCVLLLEEKQQRIRMADVWTAPASAFRMPQRVEHLLQDIPWWNSQMQQHESISVEKVHALGDHAANELRRLTGQDIVSLVSCPLVANDQLLGYLCLGQCRHGQFWPKDHQQLFSVLADIFSDALHKHAMEQKLQSKQIRLEQIIEGTNASTWEWDMQSGMITCNERFAAMLGYSPKNLNPLSHEQWRNLCCPDFLSSIEAQISRNCSGEIGYYEMEYPMLHADGSWIWVLDRGNVTRRDESGSPLLMAGTCLEVTDRKRAEEQLKHSHHLMRYIVEHSHSAIAVFDTRLHYIFFSRSHIRDFRLESRDILDVHLFDVFHRIDADWRTAIQRCLTGEILQGSEDAFVLNDGTEEIISWECRPWFDAESAIGGIILYTELITEQIRSRQQLIHTNKMESIGRLAGGVAHDFNNMLQAILGNTELALELVHPSMEISGYLHAVHQAANKSAELTKQLLAFARKQQSQPRPINLNEVVSGMLAMLTRLIGSSVQLHWSAAQDIWLTKIDPSQVDQILINLCVNARDAVGEYGDMHITVTNLVKTDQSEFVRLTVSDTGCGMDENVLERVFDPFFTTKQVGEGTGLGLPMVYGIVSQNNGTIDISSAPGEGTTVQIDFPRCRADTSAAENSEFIEETGLQPKTVLLTEDDPPVLTLLQTILSGEGHRIISAPDPKEALSYAASVETIDLLITDMIMPGMNGVELAKQFASLHPKTPILMISGYREDNTVQAKLPEERIYFLAKPFDKERLLQTLWGIFTSS